jgi:hypothetical protein
MGKPHETRSSIFGRARYVFLVGMGIMTSGAWMKQCGDLSGEKGAYLQFLIVGVCFVCAWIATSDDFFRLVLWLSALLPATYGAFRIGMYFGPHFVKDNGALFMYSVVFGALFAVLTGGMSWGWFANSPYVGFWCQNCHRRGGMSRDETSRSYNGLTESGGRILREFAVTYRHSCSYCGGSYQENSTDLRE